jgi:SAM-dependent methyltransferase
VADRREPLAPGPGELSIHPQAAQGFGRAAEEYERGRPEYPAEAIDWLARRLGLAPGRTILDVGAGTGKLTRALARTGASLIAVEPVPQMRSVLGRQVPEARLLAGRAEEIPLPDACVDAIVAGQAFHWFDGPRALVEFHRLLRPGEHLGLIWNRRDSTQPVHQAIDQIIERNRRDTPAYHRNEWATVFDDNPWFAAADRTEVFSEQTVDEQGLVDRVLSISYIAALQAAERQQVETRLRALAQGGLEPLRHRTQAFVYARLG